MLVDEFARPLTPHASSSVASPPPLEADLGIRWVCTYEPNASGPNQAVMTLRGQCAASDFPISLECPALELSVTWECSEDVCPLVLPAALPWSADTPSVYTVRFTAGGYSEDLLVGFRSLTVTGRRISVNGERLFLRGTRHGGEIAGDEDLLHLKAAGVNALLVSPSVKESFLDASDRLGLWIIREQTPSSAHRAFADLTDHPSVIGSCLVAQTPDDRERLPAAAGRLKLGDDSHLLLAPTDLRGEYTDLCLLNSPTPEACIDLMDRSSTRRLPGCNAGDTAWQRNRPFLILDPDPSDADGWRLLNETSEAAGLSSAFHGGFLADWTAVPALEHLQIFAPCPLEILVRRTLTGYRPLVTLRNRLHGVNLGECTLAWTWKTTAVASNPPSGTLCLPGCPPGEDLTIELPILEEGGLPALGPADDLWLTVEVRRPEAGTQPRQAVVGHQEWRMPGEPGDQGEREVPQGGYRPPRLSSAEPLRLGPVEFLAGGAVGIDGGQFRGPRPVVRDARGRQVQLRRTRAFERAWNEQAFRQTTGYALPQGPGSVRLEETWWQEGDDVVLRALARAESEEPVEVSLRFTVPEETDGVRWRGTGPGNRPWEPWTVGRLGEYAAAGLDVGRRWDVRWLEFLRGDTVIVRMTVDGDELGRLPEAAVEEDGSITFHTAQEDAAEMTLRFSRPPGAAGPTSRDRG